MLSAVTINESYSSDVQFIYLVLGAAVTSPIVSLFSRHYRLHPHSIDGFFSEDLYKSNNVQLYRRILVLHFFYNP